MISRESLEEQWRIQFGGSEIEDLSLISVDAEGFEASAGQETSFCKAWTGCEMGSNISNIY